MNDTPGPTKALGSGTATLTKKTIFRTDVMTLISVMAVAVGATLAYADVIHSLKDHTATLAVQAADQHQTASEVRAIHDALIAAQIIEPAGFSAIRRVHPELPTTAH